MLFALCIENHPLTIEQSSLGPEILREIHVHVYVHTNLSYYYDHFG